MGGREPMKIIIVSLKFRTLFECVSIVDAVACLQIALVNCCLYVWWSFVAMLAVPTAQPPSGPMPPTLPPMRSAAC